MRSKLLLVCTVLSIFILVCACGEETQPTSKPAPDKTESPLETVRGLTYFESKSRFVVLIKKSPQNPTEAYRNPDRFSVNVYWNIDGMTGQVRSTTGSWTYYAGWSERLKKVVVLTMDGILSISLDTGEMEEVWKAPGLLKVMWDANDALSKIVVTGYDPDKRAKFIAAIDLESGSAKTRDFAVTPSGITFTDHNIAMVSIGDDLLRVEYEHPQGWRFQQIPEPHPKGTVTMEFKGKLVWVSHAWGDKESKITCGNRTVELPGSFEQAIVYGKGLLVFAASPVEALPLRGGKVYFIDSDWRVHEVAEIEDKVIIGSGSSASILWVATEDGVVRTFGRTEKTETIDLPQYPGPGDS